MARSFPKPEEDVFVQPTDSIKRAFQHRMSDPFPQGMPLGMATCEFPHYKNAAGTGRAHAKLKKRDQNRKRRKSVQPKKQQTNGNGRRGPGKQDGQGPQDIGLHLHQALKTPLLTRDQERQLAQNIFRYRQSFQRLILKEPPVIEYLTDLLIQWDARKIRLDTICNLALSETAKRKTLEPNIRASLRTLRKLPKQLRSAASVEKRRKLERQAIQTIERLMIRPRPFESSPFTNNKAQWLLDEYRQLCQAMTCANLRLCVVVAKQLCGTSPVLIDMIQEGSRGLMHAVTKFDHRRNIRFSTYAVPWIKQSIYAALPNAERNIRIPENFGSLARSIQRRIQNSNDNQIDLAHVDSARNISRIANEMKLPPQDVDKLMCIQRDTCSLHQPGSGHLPDGAESSSCLAEIIVDHRKTNPLQIAQVQERKQFVRGLMDQVLNQREHDVISLRFGFADGIDRSLAEVGRQMGITRERVRQIEKQALEKLSKTKAPHQFV